MKNCSHERKSIDPAFRERTHRPSRAHITLWGTMLYALLLWVPTVFLTIAGLWTRLGVAGSITLHFGIFIAFAAIYPQAEMLMRIQAKWVALILAGIGTLAARALVFALNHWEGRPSCLFLRPRKPRFSRHRAAWAVSVDIWRFAPWAVCRSGIGSSSEPSC